MTRPCKPRLSGLLHDLRACALYGLLYSLAAALLGTLFCVSSLEGWPVLQAILQGCISGTFVAGSVGLVVAALMFLFLRRKDDSRLAKLWRQHFRLFPYEVGLLIMAAMPLVVGVFLDWFRAAVLGIPIMA